jgi:hypothetical protein
MLLATTAAVFLGGWRHALREEPPRVTTVEDYCWWAVFRTVLPPDTVAARFVRAFTAVGLNDPVRGGVADTAWAAAGPTALPDRGGRMFAARVVAYRRGDSTHFRHFVAAGPAPSSPSDSLREAGDRLALCGALGMGAAVHGTAPREPDGHEKLAVWQRWP